MCCCCKLISTLLPCSVVRYGLYHCCNLCSDENTTAFLPEKVHTSELKCHEPFLSELEVSSANNSISSSSCEERAECSRSIFVLPTKISTATICEANNRNECVICLDEFSKDNPPMLTLCACGENKTSFHYHCLLLWLQRKSTCPNCGRRLYYQVFTAS